MMRVLRLCLVSIILFAGAILTARMIGGTQRNPIDALFTNPDGSPCQMPCLFGIRPGVTTMEEAFQVFAKHPLTAGMHTCSSSDGKYQYYAPFVSYEAQIDLIAIDSKSNVIGTMDLRYNACPYPTNGFTPELSLIMQQANSGNQAAYFGKIGIGVENVSKRPYIQERCYLDWQVCFYTRDWEQGDSRENEPFDGLKILMPDKNSVPWDVKLRGKS